MSRLLTCIAVASLVACTANIDPVDKTRPLISGAERAKVPDSRPVTTAPFVRRYEAADELRSQSVRGERLPLKHVLALGLPGFQVVPMDTGINLAMPMTLRAEAMPAKSFLKMVGQISGYELITRGLSVEISAFTSREWVLAAFAGKSTTTARVTGGSGGSAGGGTSASGGVTTTGGGGGANEDRRIKASFDYTNDEWDGLVKTAEQIMGGSGGTAAPTTFDSAGAIVSGGVAPVQRVVAMRSQGLIRATGPVVRIRELDAWLSSLARSSTKQVRLDVRTIEVTLSDSKARGIDWNAIINQTYRAGQTVVGATVGAAYPATLPNAGSATLGLNVLNGDDNVTALLSFLSQYGAVELKTEPQVTTLSGRTAYIGSGEEFGFVSSVVQTVTTGTVALTPELQRILVGVELAITPRVLDDERVLVEIVPVVSNFRGFDNFTIGGNQFSQPRIVLQQLAVNAIARSGEPLQVGGLISSRLSEELNTLPFETRKTWGFMDYIFSSETNVLERRELMFVVTPTLVGI